MTTNYTSICHYCGKIYQSNKSTSKYCCHNHNALFHQHGSRLNYSFENYDGVLSDCKDVLEQLSSGNENLDGWGPGHDIMTIYPGHYYNGPLPLGEELILVSGYLIKKQVSLKGADSLYFFKPFQLLTKEEKATKNILQGSFEALKEMELRMGEMSVIYSDLHRSYDIGMVGTPLSFTQRYSTQNKESVKEISDSNQLLDQQ